MKQKIHPLFFHSLSWFWFGFVLLISCSSPRGFAGLNNHSPLEKAIDSVCIAQMETGRFPGMAAVVAHKKKIIWQSGYGYADVENQVPIDPALHLFRIGSISKSVTASALARMASQKEIDLDAPISKYFTQCPEDKKNITLRQLGGHLGCIRHYRGLEFLSAIHYTDVFSPLEVFIHDSLVCIPGTEYHYSTYGWTLISAVMEKAIQTPFLDIISEEVSIPMKLHALKADHPDSTHYPRVSFYEYQQNSYVLSPAVNNSNKWAGGGFLCSAADLSRFGSSLLRRHYLSKKRLSDFTASQETPDGKKTNYGIGFSTGTDDKGVSWFGHSGGSVGGTSMMLIYPDYDLVIITLVNMSGARMDRLAWKIADHITLQEKK